MTRPLLLLLLLSIARLRFHGRPVVSPKHWRHLMEASWAGSKLAPQAIELHRVAQCGFYLIYSMGCVEARFRSYGQLASLNHNLSQLESARTPVARGRKPQLNIRLTMTASHRAKRRRLKILKESRLSKSLARSLGSTQRKWALAPGGDNLNWIE